MMKDQVETDEPENCTHAPADYVIIIPNKLDEFGQVEKPSYMMRTDIMRNLLAAKLELSWYPTADNRYIIIRVAANEKRLIEEAERREMMMRKQVQGLIDITARCMQRAYLLVVGSVPGRI